jgi:hypothetical protein
MLAILGTGIGPKERCVGLKPVKWGIRDPVVPDAVVVKVEY